MEKPKEHFKFRNLDELFVDINNPLSFLSRDFHIPGMSSDDIMQELCKSIIETYQKDSKYYGWRKDGFWFIRARWHLLNLRGSAFKRDPLAKSVSIDAFLDEGGD